MYYAILNIVAPGLVADKYENNNTKETAFILNYTFNGNSTNINTVGSNFHNRTEYDFYKVNLPKGYDYEIVAKIGDRFNSLYSVDYSADILCSFDIGNGFSEAYDYTIPSSILLKNGGEAIFFVAPYSAG